MKELRIGQVVRVKSEEQLTKIGIFKSERMYGFYNTKEMILSDKKHGLDILPDMMSNLGKVFIITSYRSNYCYYIDEKQDRYYHHSWLELLDTKAAKLLFTDKP